MPAPYVSNQDPIDPTSIQEIRNDLARVENIPLDSQRLWEGNLFLPTDRDTGPIDYLSRTPNDRFIIVGFGVTTSADADFEVYEDTVVTDDGVAVPIPNKNRNFPDDAALQLFKGPTITTPGTKLAEIFVPGGKGGNAPGGGGIFAEWILKPDTLYLLRIIGVVEYSISFPFYETEDLELFVNKRSLP